jgi:hypothetical protein
MVPETAKAEVLSDGGMAEFWPLADGLRAGLGGSFVLCCVLVKGAVPILEIMFMMLFGAGFDLRTNEIEGSTYCS